MKLDSKGNHLDSIRILMSAQACDLPTIKKCDCLHSFLSFAFTDPTDTCSHPTWGRGSRRGWEEEEMRPSNVRPGTSWTQPGPQWTQENNTEGTSPSQVHNEPRRRVPVLTGRKTKTSCKSPVTGEKHQRDCFKLQASMGNDKVFRPM